MCSPLLSILWLFLPAGIANLTPVVVAKLPYLKKFTRPLDFHRTYKGIRILGDHKTIRGFITGTLMASCLSLVQYYLETKLSIFCFPLDLAVNTRIVLGAWLGLGALTGDAVKSFFKRRTSIKPGHTWFPWDQLDYILGGLLFLLPFYTPTLSQLIVLFSVYFGLHLATSYLGYLLRFKQTPI